MLAVKRRLSPLYESSKTETLSDEHPAPAKKKSWGFHLLVDASGLNKKMDSPTDIRGFFRVLIRTLKMKELTPLMLVKVKGEEGRGISALQGITTSHLCAHFDDEKRCAYIDIFSCKTFKPEIALALIKETFDPKRMTHKFLYRDAGKHG